MKRTCALLLAVVLLFPALVIAGDLSTVHITGSDTTPEGEDGFEWGEDGLYEYDEYIFPDDTAELFGGDQDIRPDAEGNICDIASIGGWTIAMAHSINDEGRLECGIYGQAEGALEWILLEGDNSVGIVPCVDSFVYYGEGSDGKQHWLVCEPGKAPQTLPLRWTDSAFYGDQSGVWYTGVSEGNKSTVYAIGLDGRNKRNLGSVRGDIKGVLADSRIVTVDYRANAVLAWKNGKSTTLYTSTNHILDAGVTNDQIWVIHDGYLGRIADGGLQNCMQGSAYFAARSGCQAVILVRDQLGDWAQARVILTNDVIHSYAELGTIGYSAITCVDMRTDAVTVWGAESRIFSIPADEYAWTAYED